MNFYYNKEGIGDTLIIDYLRMEKDGKSHVSRNGITRIFNPETDATLGYNFFDFSKSFAAPEGQGVFKPDDALISALNHKLSESGFSDQLEADNRPPFIISKINAIKPHPDADKLNLCKVDTGFETLDLVCGAPNVEEGQKVVVARLGAIMPSGTVIKETELRGVISPGMICSARELGLADAPQKKGVLVLEGDQTVGDAFLAG